MDDENEFSCILYKETDSSQNFQKLKTGIKTLISNCEKKKIERKEQLENTRNKILEFVANKTDKFSLTFRRRYLIVHILLL